MHTLIWTLFTLELTTEMYQVKNNHVLFKSKDWITIPLISNIEAFTRMATQWDERRWFSPLRRSRADLTGGGSRKTRFRVLLIDSNRVPRVWMNERVGESSHRLNGESPTGDHKVHACVPTVVHVLCSSHTFSLFLPCSLVLRIRLRLWIDLMHFLHVSHLSWH